MSKLHGRTFAISAVVMMLCTVLAGFTIMTDESSAAFDGNHGSPSAPLDTLVLTEDDLMNNPAVGSNNFTFYVKLGAYVNIPVVSSDGYDLTFWFDWQHFLSNSIGGLSVYTVSPEERYIRGTVTGPGTLTVTGFWELEGEGIIEDSTMTIIAVQSSYTHTIHYGADGGTGTMSDTVVTDSNSGGSNVTLASCGFTKQGYRFDGWLVNGVLMQPGQKVTVSGGSTVTVTAKWTQCTLSIGSVPTQYAVMKGSVSFAASCTGNPSGSSVTYTPSGVPSGVSVNVSGSTVTISSSTAGSYSFTLTASSAGCVSSSTTVTVQFVPVLAFANTPSAGALNA